MPMQIDHDPEEPKVDRGPGPWKSLFVVLLVGLFINLFTRSVDWVSLSLGAAIGGCFVAWAIEITGNKVPDSWRGKSGHSRRSGLDQR
ncbi:hypothetical protein ELI05_09430 [Rhizobium leguminosarum]|nr:hypothetical protein ELI05_09430 [Rhizobium leguminosarum]